MQGSTLPTLAQLYGGKPVKTTIEQVVRFDPPDAFEEKMIFEEVVTDNSRDRQVSLQRHRTFVESWIDGQKIPGPDRSDPLVSLEVHPKGEWPQPSPEIEDHRTFRLWRATRYVPVSSFTIAADPDRRIPAATYRASLAKGEIQTVFAETGGLTARGTWKLDEKQRFLSAKIVCENAFAPGGDGTPATFTLVITTRKP